MLAVRHVDDDNTYLKGICLKLYIVARPKLNDFTIGWKYLKKRLSENLWLLLKNNDDKKEYVKLLNIM